MQRGKKEGIMVKRSCLKVSLSSQISLKEGSNGREESNDTEEGSWSSQSVGTVFARGGSSSQLGLCSSDYGNTSGGRS